MTLYIIMHCRFIECSRYLSLFNSSGTLWVQTYRLIGTSISRPPHDVYTHTKVYILLHIISFLQDLNWHMNFPLPQKQTLGYSVCQAIETGVVTSAARRRLVDVMSRCILVHTMKPSPEQYNHVCFQLITKFPKLRDQGLEGHGSGYVSFSKA